MVSRIVSRKEVAQHFGVSVSTVRSWIKKGQLKEGQRVGKEKTICSDSFEALKKDELFIQGLRKNQESTAVNLSSRLSQLEALVKKQDEIITHLKERVSLLETKGVTPQNLQERKNLTLQKQDEKKSHPAMTNAEKKAFIQQCVEAGVFISDICPEGRGSALGKWLRDETYPLQKNIELWYSNAKNIWEEREHGV